MRHVRLLPLIVACALFIENMDSTVISTSLPAMAADLGTDAIALKLALTAYLLSLAVFIPVSAWIADRFGARTTFISAIFVFLLGSLACAASGSLGALVAMGVAAKLPDLVTAVVLLDPPGPRFLANLDATPYAFIWSALQKRCGRKDVSAVTKELSELRVPTPKGEVRYGDTRDAASVRFVARCLKDLDPGVFDPPLKKQWLEGFDILATAKQVKCPALLVVADPALGGTLPPEDATPLAAALPDCTRVDLPGVGHLIHWQDTPATLRLLHSFLNSL